MPSPSVPTALRPPIQLSEHFTAKFSGKHPILACVVQQVVCDDRSERVLLVMSKSLALCTSDGSVPHFVRLSQLDSIVQQPQSPQWVRGDRPYQLLLRMCPNSAHEEDDLLLEIPVDPADPRNPPGNPVELIVAAVTYAKGQAYRLPLPVVTSTIYNLGQFMRPVASGRASLQAVTAWELPDRESRRDSIRPNSPTLTQELLALHQLRQQFADSMECGLRGPVGSAEPRSIPPPSLGAHLDGPRHTEDQPPNNSLETSLAISRDSTEKSADLSSDRLLDRSFSFLDTPSLETTDTMTATEGVTGSSSEHDAYRQEEKEESVRRAPPAFSPRVEQSPAPTPPRHALETPPEEPFPLPAEARDVAEPPRPRLPPPYNPRNFETPPATPMNTPVTNPVSIPSAAPALPFLKDRSPDREGEPAHQAPHEPPSFVEPPRSWREPLRLPSRDNSHQESTEAVHHELKGTFGYLNPAFVRVVDVVGKAQSWRRVAVIGSALFLCSEGGSMKRLVRFSQIEFITHRTYKSPQEVVVHLWPEEQEPDAVLGMVDDSRNNAPSPEDFIEALTKECLLAGHEVEVFTEASVRRSSQARSEASSVPEEVKGVYAEVVSAVAKGLPADSIDTYLEMWDAVPRQIRKVALAVLDALVAADRKATEFEEEIRDLRIKKATFDEMREEANDLRAQLKQMKMQLEDSSSTSALEEAVSESKAEASELREQLERKCRELERAEQNASKDGVRRQLAESQDLVKALRLQLDDARARLSVANNKLKEAERNARPSTPREAEALDELRLKLSEVQSERDAANEETRLAEEKRSETLKKLNDLTAKHLQSERKWSRQVKELEARLQKTEGSIGQAEALEAAELQISLLNEKLFELRARFTEQEAIEAENERLRAENARLMAEMSGVAEQTSKGTTSRSTRSNSLPATRSSEGNGRDELPVRTEGRRRSHERPPRDREIASSRGDARPNRSAQSESVRKDTKGYPMAAGSPEVRVINRRTSDGRRRPSVLSDVSDSRTPPRAEDDKPYGGYRRCTQGEPTDEDSPCIPIRLSSLSPHHVSPAFDKEREAEMHIQDSHIDPCDGLPARAPSPYITVTQPVQNDGQPEPPESALSPGFAEALGKLGITTQGQAGLRRLGVRTSRHLEFVTYSELLSVLATDAVERLLSTYSLRQSPQGPDHFLQSA